MIILSLHRRIHRPSHTPQMYLYRLVLLSYKGLFYKRFGEGGGGTNSDGGAGMTEAYLFMRLLPRVLPSIQRAKALRTQIPDMPLQSDRASPSPYRTYSSYPAGGKVSFS